MKAVDIIIKKRDGKELTKQEIEFFIQGYAEGTIPDYQAASWTMAVLLKGMTAKETTDLTMAMVNSGETLDLSPAVPVRGIGGISGYILITDEYAGMDFVIFIKHKSDLLPALVAWKKFAENHFATVMGSIAFPVRLANMRCDGAGENTSNELRNWCKQEGIW